MFDAELSGTALNMRLLRRLLGWMKPYRITFGVSAVLILVSSTLQVLLPVIISLVVIDHIIRGTAPGMTPDLGMVDSTDWIAANFRTATARSPPAFSTHSSTRDGRSPDTRIV